jgi:V8-like Glu-specific endopeptidase
MNTPNLSPSARCHNPAWLTAALLLAGLAHELYSSSSATALGSIIIVDTTNNSSPPITSPSNYRTDAGQPGYPQDFLFYARKKYDEDSMDMALVKALVRMKEMTRSKLESPQHDESPVHGFSADLLTHPSLYADPDDIHHDERVPDGWHFIVDRRRQLIGDVLRSVGRIQVEQLDQSYNNQDARLQTQGFETGLVLGTGFVVQKNVIMTNKHVATFFCSEKSPYSFKVHKHGGQRCIVKIDFAGVYGRDPELCTITKVLYLSPTNVPDIALLEFESRPVDPLGHGPRARNGRKPLVLQTQKPRSTDSQRKMFVCGYPTTFSSSDLADENSFSADFMKILGVKRVSFGEFMPTKESNDRATVFHNCTTLGGSSGSPLVDFDTGTVWGLHYGGGNRHGNLAEPLWRICAIPEVQSILGRAATEPPAQSAADRALPLGMPESSVANAQVSRPVMFACPEHSPEDHLAAQRLFQSDDRKRQNVERVLPAVGLIIENKPETSDGGTLGAGFLIGPGIMLTSGHFSMTKPGGDALGAGVEFSRTVCDDSRSARIEAKRARVDSVIYKNDRETNTLRKFSLLKVVAPRGEVLPAPIPLQVEMPRDSLAETDIFVVGHPQRDLRIPPEVFYKVFPPPYGVKRLAFGKVMNANRNEVWHDSSTAGGDGGAPVVCLSTGRVLGMHVEGTYLETNIALSMWKILEDPEVRQIPGIREILEKSQVQRSR